MFALAISHFECGGIAFNFRRTKRAEKYRSDCKEKTSIEQQLGCGTDN